MYGDLTGQCKADYADFYNWNDLLREKGLIGSTDMVLRVNVYNVGENRKSEEDCKKLEPISIHITAEIVRDAHNFDNLKRMLADDPDNYDTIDLPFKFDEFLNVFKRFQMSLELNFNKYK